MAHIETKDPFGFVGSHVIRRQSRKDGEEHGWLTRYDEALDCYTLFVPGGGEPRLLARGEVMKFLSAPNIQLDNDDHDTFPPPVKDTTTSRYLGVKLCRSRQNSSDSKSGVDKDVRGHVKFFLPFADRYSVEYEDGSTEEISESAVINGMIALIKSPFFSSTRRTKKRNGSVRTRKRAGSIDEDKLEPGRWKRQRIEITRDADVQEIPFGSVAVIANVVDEQQDDDVVFVDQTEMKDIVDRKTESAPNILEITSSPLGSATREYSLEMASHPVEKLMLSDKDNVAGQDDIVEIQDCQKEPDSNEPTIVTKPVDAANSETQEDVPFYVVDAKPHVAIEPFPRRAIAFELLRISLLNLLDRREASIVKVALQYDLLRNPDVRDRDAVTRFIDADGLVVLNHLLNLFATDVLDDDEESKEDGVGISPETIRERMKRDEELLYVLKLVAMLPTPSRKLVIASNIGKTINYLNKTNGPPGRRSTVPKCITALAKWVKTSWIKNIPPAPKAVSRASVNTRQPLNRPQQQARRGGHSGRRNLRLNLRHPPPSQRQVSSAPVLPDEHEALQDNTPIPRLSRPRQIAKPQQPVAPSQFRVRGSLKPDWMIQKEKLSRSRFCIDDNKNVDTRLYWSSRTHPVTNASTQQDQNMDQNEDAGGLDGVFGRAQRLRFGKRWSIQEFRKKDPPGTLRQLPRSSYSVPSYGHSQYSDQHLVHVPPVPSSSRRPRPILRCVSRYNDEPAIDGPGG